MSLKLINSIILNTLYTTHHYSNHHNCKPPSRFVRTLAFELEVAWIRENKLLTLIRATDNG